MLMPSYVSHNDPLVHYSLTDTHVTRTERNTLTWTN